METSDQLPKASVLVVDDTEANLLAFSAVLEPLGHRLVMARSGHEALHRTERDQFAVIVMDVQMPGLDGITTVDRMRRSGRAVHTPIVFVSASGDDQERLLRAYALGAVDYLSKPVQPQILRTKVGALALLHQQRVQLERQAAIIVSKERETADAIAAKVQAERANLLKDRYIGILGHDLRTPVSVVAMTAQRFKQLSPEPGPIRDGSERLLNAAHRMGSMINDLIDFTRGQLGGGIPLARSADAFGDLCQKVVDELRVVHPGRDIRLDAGGDLSGEWDGPRVQQALGNLIGNALQHGRGQVSVTVRGEHAGIVLTVHNGGAPIPPDDLPTIFEPFRKGERRSEGLGLGLYIVREIVQGHGGSVHAWSSDAEGTTFLTFWPRDGSRTPSPEGTPGPFAA